MAAVTLENELLKAQIAGHEEIVVDLTRQLDEAKGLLLAQQLEMKEKEKAEEEKKGKPRDSRNEYKICYACYKYSFWGFKCQNTSCPLNGGPLPGVLRAEQMLEEFAQEFKGEWQRDWQLQKMENNKLLERLEKLEAGVAAKLEGMKGEVAAATDKWQKIEQDIDEELDIRIGVEKEWREWQGTTDKKIASLEASVGEKAMAEEVEEKAKDAEVEEGKESEAEAVGEGNESGDDDAVAQRPNKRRKGAGDKETPVALVARVLFGIEVPPENEQTEP